uniref:Beta-lactamase-related domain-containing protein n=1 Tax=Ditylenchus dipsaci TaxID=166011 RepID=A0A915CZK8_9BILA
MHNNEWFRVEKNCCSFNNPAIWRLEQVACLGISTARDLAKIFALMLSGKLLSKDLSKQFVQPELLNRRDVVVGVPFSKGHGFMYERHPTKAKKWLYGHQGYGGSTLMIEPEEELVIAYVSNSIKTGTGELGRCYRLMRNAALDCAIKI